MPCPGAAASSLPRPPPASPRGLPSPHGTCVPARGAQGGRRVAATSAARGGPGAGGGALGHRPQLGPGTPALPPSHRPPASSSPPAASRRPSLRRAGLIGCPPRLPASALRWFSPARGDGGTVPPSEHPRRVGGGGGARLLPARRGRSQNGPGTVPPQKPKCRSLGLLPTQRRRSEPWRLVRFLSKNENVKSTELVCWRTDLGHLAAVTRGECGRLYAENVPSSP